MPISPRSGRDGFRPWMLVGSVWVTLAIASGLYFSFPVFFVALFEEFGWSRGATALASQLFHGRRFGVIYGILSVGNGIGGGIAPWFGGAIHDVTGSYRPRPRRAHRRAHVLALGERHLLARPPRCHVDAPMSCHHGPPIRRTGTFRGRHAVLASELSPAQDGKETHT